MAREIRSTARPTTLRLAGFVCVAAGAVVAGVGASREWAAVGFPSDLRGSVDVPWHGTDVWEGKVVLLGAAAALVALIAMRVSLSGRMRRALALGVLAIGVICVALPLLDAVRAEDRFGGVSGEDRMAEALAAELELPEDVVREQLAEEFARSLRVDVGAGIWIAAAGGALLAAGGLLSLVWARERRPVPAIEALD